VIKEAAERDMPIVDTFSFSLSDVEEEEEEEVVEAVVVEIGDLVKLRCSVFSSDRESASSASASESLPW